MNSVYTLLLKINAQMLHWPLTRWLSGCINLDIFQQAAFDYPSSPIRFLMMNPKKVLLFARASFLKIERLHQQYHQQQ